MKISIVMATYNGEKFLAKQLKSMLEQTILPDEIVIVDDCSQDQTIEILDNFIEQMKNNKKTEIKIYKNINNLGVVKSFTKAITLAKGDLIFLSDQDDVWEKNKIEELTDIFDKNKDIGLIATGYKLIDENKKIIKQGNRLNKLKKVNISQISKGNHFPGCTMAFRFKYKEAFDKVPESVHIHDWYIAIISAAEDGFYFYTKPLIMYRLHSSNTIGLNRTLKPACTKNERLNWLTRRIKFYDALIENLDNYSFLSQNDRNNAKKELLISKKFAKERLNILEECNVVTASVFVVKNFKRYDYFRGLIGDLYWIIKEK